MASRAAGSRRKQLQPVQPVVPASPSVASRAFASHPNELVPRHQDPPALAKPLQSYEPLPNLTSDSSIWRHTEHDPQHHSEPEFASDRAQLADVHRQHQQQLHQHPHLHLQQAQNLGQHHLIDNNSQVDPFYAHQPTHRPQRVHQALPTPKSPHSFHPVSGLEMNIPPGPNSPSASSFGPSSFATSTSASALSPFINRIHETRSHNAYHSQHDEQQHLPSSLASLPSPSYSPPRPAVSSGFPATRSQQIQHSFRDQTPSGPGARFEAGGPYLNDQYPHPGQHPPARPDPRARLQTLSAAAAANEALYNIPPHHHQHIQYHHQQPHYRYQQPQQQQQHRHLRPVASSASLDSIHNDHRYLYQQKNTGSFDSASILSHGSGFSQDHNPPGSGRRSDPTVIMPFSSPPSGLIAPTTMVEGQTPSFVYPGGRSRAHPNGAPRFRLRGKKKKDKNRQNNKNSHNANKEPSNGVKTNGDNVSKVAATNSSDPSTWGPPNGLPSPPLSHEAIVSAAGGNDSGGPYQTSESAAHFGRTTGQGHPPASLVPASDGRKQSIPNAGPTTTAASDNRRNSTTSVNSWDEVQPRQHTRVIGLASKSRQRTESPATLASSPYCVVGPTDECDFSDGGSRTFVASSTSSRPTTASSAPKIYDQPHSASGVSGRVLKLSNKVGHYPLDPYDSTLLDLDLHTYTLLRKLRPSETCPTFHDYGGSPPATALDLGCGQGHWLLDAAIAWKGFGTKITGLDMVDITKTLRPVAIKLGVAENIKFVRGNFLKHELPFQSDSFDLVRISCLTLAIPFERWQPLLEEVSRVLAVGGRLEIVDDQAIFPYPPVPTAVSGGGGASVTSSTRRNTSPAATQNDLYRLREEDETKEDISDTDTLHESRRAEPSPVARGTAAGAAAGPLSSLTAALTGSQPPDDDDSWQEHVAAAHELESLFEHMLNHKYGLHLHPSEFLLNLLRKVFGHSREMANVNVMLDLPPLPQQQQQQQQWEQQDGLSRRGGSGELETTVDLLGNCPGIIVWPSATQIPMNQVELDNLISVQPKLLLSCKSALVEYALDVADGDDIDEETILEALWEYEGFIRQRFCPPASAIKAATAMHMAAVGSMAHESSDNRSGRGSVFSMATTNTVSSEGLAAIRDYQEDLSGVLDFNSLLVGTEVGRTTATSGVNGSRTPTSATQDAAPSLPPIPPQAELSLTTQTATRARSGSVTTTGTRVPPYSPLEPCRVRNFHIYEAIKMP